MSPPTYEELFRQCQSFQSQLVSFKETRTQLLESQRQLTRLFNNLPGMAYRCSLDAKLHPTLVFVSRGSLDLFDVPPNFFTDQKTNVMETLAHPDDLPGMRQEQDEAILGRRPYKMYYRVLLGDGTVKWIWDQGECVYDANDIPIHLEGIMIDISAQKLREYELLQENQRLKGAIGDSCKFGKIVGKSPQMQEVIKLITMAAKSDANVIIFGETGTGKDLVAQTIHELSGLSGPYVAVNCGAIPANLMESEFFGHKKGAFSGAISDRRGYLAQADGGTLFLDEVGEIELSLQVKLLRALESKQFHPVGNCEHQTSRFRLVAATNRDLGQMVREGRMRADFFFRLHVLPIRVPPLRERREDLPLLVSECMSRILGKPASSSSIPAKVRAAFDAYDWPGNIRELQNVLERYLAFGEVVLSDFGIEAEAGGGQDEILALAKEASSLEECMDAVERRILLKTLERHHWKKGLTAKCLGLSLRTMQRKMKKFGL